MNHNGNPDMSVSVSSLGSPHVTSVASSLLRRSLHCSVSRGGKESEEQVTVKTPPVLHLKPKLPRLLKKAGATRSSHRHLVKIMDSSDDSRSKKLEEQMNYEHLQKLECMFREADIDGGGGLDMDEFREAMKKMGNIPEEDIDVIFMKVDTNCDGSVDWEEYLNYMLSEYQGKEIMQKSKEIPGLVTPMRPVPVAHSEEIIKIQFFPSQSRGMKFKKGQSTGTGRSRSTSGRFLTVSRDGILQFWSDSFKLLRMVHLDQRKQRPSVKLWVMDMVCLPNINLMAIASTEQNIEFFDIGGNKCDLQFSLELDVCASAMDYWTDGFKGVFCVGDVKGNILIFTSMNVVTNGLFNIRACIGGLAKVPVHILMRGKTDPYRNFTVPMLCCTGMAPPQREGEGIGWEKMLVSSLRVFRGIEGLHEDWCHQIMFIPQLNLVASCTPAENTAMALTLLPLKNVGKTQSAMIVLRKGILCFDYSSEMNILVTGGYDPLIRIWSLYVTSSPVTQLKGHTTAVTHIMNIRVWDLLDHFCVQSIQSKNVPLGRAPISAAYYHATANVVACATCMIGLFFETEISEVEVKTQDLPVCCALYNKNFKEVVSGYYSGLVTVWDFVTGQKIMEFRTSEGELVEITAMAFDGPERRLITGLKNGMTKLWNFNSGACLAVLPSVDKKEISCISYLDEKIFVTGWSRRVTWYLDAKGEDKFIECKHWKSYHSDDILSMDSYNNKLLVTSSCNGDIILWNVNSGQAFCRFNASQSPLALHPQREFLVSPDGPSLKGPKKARLPQDELGKKILSYSGKKHSLRPASANYPRRASVSSPTRRISLPQPAWYVQGNHKSTNLQQEKQAVETGGARPPKGDLLTQQGGGGSSSVAVEKVIFLNTRKCHPETAVLLTSSSNGYIHAWAVGGKSGMVGKFRGAHGFARDTVVTDMSTDLNNLVLFTSDSLGYIKIWDIQNYCRPSQTKETNMETGEEPPPPENVFCSLIPEHCWLPEKFPPAGKIETVDDGWVTSLIPPPCLNSWRGHLKTIGSIRYVEKFRAILTSSHDGKIRLWLLSGRHVGTFGQSTWRLEGHHMGTAEMPEDIRRVGSLHTLRVLNEGRQPHWESTRNILHTLVLRKKRQSILLDFLHLKPRDTSAGSGKMQELILKERRMSEFTDEQVETSFQKWEESGKLKSDILGHSYKPKVPRPPLKGLSDVKGCVADKEQARIYHCIQYTNLRPVPEAQIPESLREAQQQAQAAAEQRATRKGKKWAALQSLVAKPSVRSFMRQKQALYAKEVGSFSGLA